MCIYLKGGHVHRYGCKLSQKLFVGKEYVLKHIKLKHTAVMEAQRDKVCQSLGLLFFLPKENLDRLQHQHVTSIVNSTRQCISGMR